jgi:hypothetical protein
MKLKTLKRIQMDCFLFKISLNFFKITLKMMNIKKIKEKKIKRFIIKG